MDVEFKPCIHNRKSTRLTDYDYSQTGAYFITICTYERRCLFGGVVDGSMHLNKYGRIVENEWLCTASIRSNVLLDEFVVMPNHFHGIVILTDERATHRVAPTQRPHGPKPGSIGAIIGQFKSIVTKSVNSSRGESAEPVWQRNCYEHVIRDEGDMKSAREYILDNPARWADDEYNPKQRGEKLLGSRVQGKRKMLSKR